MKKNYIIPIFLPQLGCKFRCIFCNQEAIVKEENVNCDLTSQINKYISTISTPNPNIELAFYGGTFTGLDFSIQANLLKQVKPFIDNGQISGIRISTRPDELSLPQVELLKSYNVTVVELGVQSLADKILNLAERGHTAADVQKAVKILKEKKIKISLQMMVGLPGENLYLFKKSVKLACDLKPDFLRIHPTIVLKGTKLEQLFKEGKYKPITLNQAINRCLYFLQKSEKKRIKIIRMGLYPSDELRTPGVIIAGPFHPAFRDLVEGENFFRMITKKIAKKNCKGSTLEIQVNPVYSSSLRGQKSCNIKRLKNRYKFKDIKIIENLNVKLFKLHLIC